MATNVVYVHGIGEMGGAEKDLLSYLDLIDRNNFHPHVVCPGSGDFIHEVKKRQVPVSVVCIPPWRKLKGLIRVPFAVLELVKIFRQWQINFVHVNDYWWFPQAYLAARICNIPIVVHIRQQIEPVRIKQYWLQRPDYLFPVSMDIERVLLDMGVNSDRISVTYSGIDPNHFFSLRDKIEFYRRYNLEENRVVIGTVANLFPRKGYEYLIEALVDVKKTFPEICCFIVGEGPKSYCKELARLVEEKGLNSNVMFVGFQKDVYDFLNAFDLFVLPSLMEGFGIALLEAMAMSKAIVASGVGGVPEVITHGETGLLVPSKDSKSLAGAIIRMLQDDRMRQRLGFAAREIIETKFTQDIAIQTIQNCYYSILAEECCSRNYNKM